MGTLSVVDRLSSIVLPPRAAESWREKYSRHFVFLRRHRRPIMLSLGIVRAKLEPDPRRPRYLVTEAGLGYRLHVDE